MKGPDDPLIRAFLLAGQRELSGGFSCWVAASQAVFVPQSPAAGGTGRSSPALGRVEEGLRRKGLACVSVPKNTIQFAVGPQTSAQSCDAGPSDCYAQMRL